MDGLDMRVSHKTERERERDGTVKLLCFLLVKIGCDFINVHIDSQHMAVACDLYKTVIYITGQ